MQDNLCKRITTVFHGLPSLEVWDGEEDLHCGVHIAAVSKIPHSSVARPVQGRQLAARLLNHIPLTHFLVDVNL